MNQERTNEGKPEEERKFNQDQYEMLKRCSGKKDMTDEAGDIVHGRRAGGRVFAARWFKNS